MRAVIVVISVGFLLGTLAQSCEISVSESLMKRLLNSTQSNESCPTLWNNVLNHLHYKEEKLNTCQDRELAVSATEPSVSECQKKLEDMRRIMLNNRKNYTSIMDQRITLNKRSTRKSQREKATLKHQIVIVGRGLKSLYRQQIFLNIGAGSSKQAIKYFHRYLEGKPPGSLLNDLVHSVYRDPIYENERLEHLLDFVRKLASSRVKQSLYQLIYSAMKKRPKQCDSYLAMVLALDVGRIAFATENNVEGRRLYLDIFQPAQTYLKRAVETGSYDEIVTFATKYPKHFEEIENRLTTMDTNTWNRIDFNRLVTYPNRLPLPKQRLEAFRMLLLQINQRNKSDFTGRLVKVAKELERCETFVRDGKSEHADLEKLNTVKGLFSKLDRNKDYDHYLNESKKQ